MRRSHARSSLLAVAALGLVACTDSTTARPSDTTATARQGDGAGTTTPGSAGTGSTRPRAAAPGRSRLALDAVDDCADLTARLRTLVERHVTPWGLDVGGDMVYATGGTPRAMPAGAATTAAASAARSAAPAEEQAPAGVAGDSSGTNTQEAGVDEGDQVENDGRHVYAVVDGRLRVVDVTTGEQAAVSLPDDGGSRQLVLDGNRLVVVSAAAGPIAMAGGVRPAGAIYGGFSGATVVTVLDVSEPMRPQVRERRQFEGTAVAVRAAGGVVRVVLTSELGARIPFVQPAQGGAAVEERARKANLEAVRAATADDWLPHVGDPTDSATIANGRRALDCDQVSIPAVESGLGLTWVASIDTSGSVRGSAGVVASGGVTYATADHLYVTTIATASGTGDPALRPARPSDPETAVHRFALGQGTDARYEATGVVPGTLLNSYAMSEKGDALRVATTVDHVDGTPSSSGLHVLRPEGSELVEVGRVTGLGRTERIYAVRYVGDYGYVVTFRRTDPLYVIDLRDDTRPTLAGELKIPGYSAYLHPLGDGRLLGIGQDATDTGRVTGLQVSLFDVRDPAAPKRLADLDLGGSSAAEWDPHAFLWWAPTSEAFVPVLPGWGGGNDAAGLPNPSGLVAVGVDGDRLVLDGTLASPGIDGGRYSGADPRTGLFAWQQPVDRAMVVGGKLVAVSAWGLRVAELSSLTVGRDIAWTR